MALYLPSGLIIQLNWLFFVRIEVGMILSQSPTSPIATSTRKSIMVSSYFYQRTKGTKPEWVGLSTIIWLLTSEGKKVCQLSDDTQQRAIFIVNVVALNCWMMGCWTMEQQAALGMARALPAALYSSNDSLSANSRCLLFKAGQVNKVSPRKSINKRLFTHWLIVLVVVLALSLSPMQSLSMSLVFCASLLSGEDRYDGIYVMDIFGYVFGTNWSTDLCIWVSVCGDDWVSFHLRICYDVTA